MTRNKIFLVFSLLLSVSLASALSIDFYPVARDFFLAAVSETSVNVLPYPTNCGADGSCLVPVADTAIRNGAGGYYPATTVPTPPSDNPQNSSITNTTQQPAQQKNIPLNNANGYNLSKMPAGLLPSAVADLSQKIPQFAGILSNLGVKNQQDVAKLKNYNIFLPGLTQITGGNLLSLNPDQKNKIPSDTIFVLLGNNNISAATKLDFSNNALALQESSVLVAKPIRLIVRPSSLAKSMAGYVLFEPSALSDPNQKFSVLAFNYHENGDGIYVADIHSPSVAGRYQIATSIQYADAKLGQKEIKTVMLTDPDGYVYEKYGNSEARINGATASLYYLNSKNQYELWGAREYGQENPQMTDVTGNYSFLVPAGTYYMTIQAQGYYPYQSDAFSVMEGKEVRSNVELKRRTNIYSFLNWQDMSIFILFCLVIYNFYRDAKKEKSPRRKP